jgi:hypothetical protein
VRIGTILKMESDAELKTAGAGGSAQKKPFADTHK